MLCTKSFAKETESPAAKEKNLFQLCQQHDEPHMLFKTAIINSSWWGREVNIRPAGVSVDMLRVRSANVALWMMAAYLHVHH